MLLSKIFLFKYVFVLVPSTTTYSKPLQYTYVQFIHHVVGILVEFHAVFDTTSIIINNCKHIGNVYNSTMFIHLVNLTGEEHDIIRSHLLMRKLALLFLRL